MIIAPEQKFESALRESEERFRSAFDHAAIGMAIVALDGRFLQVNRSLCRIVGYSEQELLVRDFQSITHPEDLKADMVHSRELIAGKTTDYQMVKRYIHKQGHQVWVLLSVSIVRDEHGKPLYFISQIQDITRRQQAEEALRASEEEYRATFELAGVGKLQVDLHNGRILRANARVCHMLGFTADELYLRSISRITHTDDSAEAEASRQKLMSGELDDYTTETRFVRKDSRILWVNLNAAVIRNGQGHPVRTVCTVQDITDKKHAEWLERDRRQVLEMVARDMPLDEVLDQLAQALERQVAGSAAALMVLQDGEVRLHGPHLPPTWHERPEATRLALAARLSAGYWGSVEACGVTFLATDEIWIHLRPIALKHGLLACWTVNIMSTDSTPLGLLTLFCRQQRHPSHAEIQTVDMIAKLAAISIEHHNTTRQLAHLVRHDPLTGLPNRILFEDRVQNAMALARRSGKFVAVLVLDIDHFKDINDNYGHHAGDHVLQQFAARMRSRLRETDTMARVGGDEFIIVLPELTDREGAVVVAKKLVDALAEPFPVGDQQIHATTSIGIAIFPEEGQDAVTIQKRADAALYRVKQRGRNGFSL